MSFTIQEAQRRASLFLQQHGVDEAALEAEILVRELHGWDRATLFTHWLDPFAVPLEQQLESWLQRRVAGEPIQYIIGHVDFYGLTFDVGEGCLIPRPETELLVDAALKRYYQHPVSTIADIGTGSGAIAVTLAYHLPEVQVIAVDLSPRALQYAQRNATKLGVESRITWLEGDGITPLQTAGIKVGMLLSNPPYIASAQIATLDRKVREYEPRLALDGGETGLVFYEQTAPFLPEVLQPEGWVAMEVGAGQSEAVETLFHAHGAKKTAMIEDFQGILRHVIAFYS